VAVEYAAIRCYVERPYALAVHEYASNEYVTLPVRPLGPQNCIRGDYDTGLLSDKQTPRGAAR